MRKIFVKRLMEVVKCPRGLIELYDLLQPELRDGHAPHVPYATCSCTIFCLFYFLILIDEFWLICREGNHFVMLEYVWGLLWTGSGLRYRAEGGAGNGPPNPIVPKSGARVCFTESCLSAPGAASVRLCCATLQQCAA